MSKILLFAGTHEGRKLAEYLAENNIETYVCVATEYGEKILPENPKLKVSARRLNTKEMEELIKEEVPEIIIDATHPYAVEVTKNIQEAVANTGKEYIRLLRETAEKSEEFFYAGNVDEVVEYLEKTSGNVLITTGSKELKNYVNLSNYKERLYPRVLPSKEVLEECEKLGIQGKNLICMQGPFSEELNFAILKETQAKYMVTKDSGENGGFKEKTEAAIRAGVKTIVIGRQTSEDGISYEGCLKYLSGKFGIISEKEIVLAGIGMGSQGTMTIDCEEAIKSADLVIGAKRILESLERFNKPQVSAVYSEDIIKIIKDNGNKKRILVALSGDVGFYSGAKKLIENLKEYKIKLIPGISSVVLFSSRLKMPWEDIKLLSNHGKESNFILAVKSNKKSFMLLGKEDDVSEISKELMKFGLSNVKIYVGENLSYEDEKITTAIPSELIDKVFAPLSVIIIVNDEGGEQCRYGSISDDEFIRDEVPMTKEEIRTISISKLNLSPNSVVYDIGAGTGSVSIEIALKAYNGKVFAIERNQKALQLIKKNKEKFGVENLIEINEFAPFEDDSILAPTHAFIGGTGKKMSEIIKWLLVKNPDVKIVINTVTIESLSEALKCIKEFKMKNVDITQVSITKTKKAGEYHLMTAHNPVYIIYMSGGEICLEAQG